MVGIKNIPVIYQLYNLIKEKYRLMVISLEPIFRIVYGCRLYKNPLVSINNELQDLGSIDRMYNNE